jgi:hypothetical protein
MNDRIQPWLRYGLMMALGVAHAQTFSTWASGGLQIIILSLAWAMVAVARPQDRPVRQMFVFALAWFCSGLYWLHFSMHDIGGLPTWLSAAAIDSSLNHDEYPNSARSMFVRLSGIYCTAAFFVGCALPLHPLPTCAWRGIRHMGRVFATTGSNPRFKTAAQMVSHHHTPYTKQRTKQHTNRNTN